MNEINHIDLKPPVARPQSGQVQVMPLQVIPQAFSFQHTDRFETRKGRPSKIPPLSRSNGTGRFGGDVFSVSWDQSTCGIYYVTKRNG